MPFLSLYTIITIPFISSADKFVIATSNIYDTSFFVLFITVLLQTIDLIGFEEFNVVNDLIPPLYSFPFTIA